MRQRIDIRGVIVSNDCKDDWIGFECTTPADVFKVLSSTADDVDVYINSYGGEIASGSEIYTMLREAAQTRDVAIHITGAAHSAASVIACAAWSEMSPTALMMVHCVSSWAAGNHSAMEKEAETLRAADQALSSAYTEKSGMTQEQALEMMEQETWLTADKAKEYGLIDEIMFEQPGSAAAMVAFAGTGILSAFEIVRIREKMAEQSAPEEPGWSAEDIEQARQLQKGRLAVVRKQ